MVHRLFKFKLLLDENLSKRTSFPRLNSRYDVKHVVQDYHKQGVSDDEVYKLGISSGRIIITINKKDFTNFPSNKKTGVIGLSPNLTIDQIDSKITSFLSKSNMSHVYGHINYLTINTVELII